MTGKRFFGYSKHNGKAYAVIIYDSLPTYNGLGTSLSSLYQMIEITAEEDKALNIHQLSEKYPYKETENEKTGVSD